MVVGALATFQTFTVTNTSGANLTFNAIPYALPAGGGVIGTESCANATLVPMGTQLPNRLRLGNGRDLRGTRLSMSHKAA